MMTVINCITDDHNLWLVLLAAGVCAVGVFVVLRLYRLALATMGSQSLGWLFLTAVTAGSSIWSTHFIAMLGFRIDAPVTFEPMLTAVSLMIAIVGAGAGFVMAARLPVRSGALIGGAVVGL
ncbi:MAG: MHYT domain-containing protein, partial [Sphingomonadales bacterium]